MDISVSSHRLQGSTESSHFGSHSSSLLVTLVIVPAGRPTSKFGLRLTGHLSFEMSSSLCDRASSFWVCDTGHLSFEMSCSFTVQVQRSLIY